MNNEEAQNNQEKEPKGSVGALWGTLIVMMLLLAGAFYMFSQKIDVEKQATVLQEVNDNSDEIKAIEIDSKNTELQKNLKNIESKL